MTQKCKFYLIQNDMQKNEFGKYDKQEDLFNPYFFLKKEVSINKAKELAKWNEEEIYTVFEVDATPILSYKTEKNIVETVLSKLVTHSDTAKFKIDDLVLLDGSLYYIINVDNVYVGIAPINGDFKQSRAVLSKDVTRVENPRTRQEYFEKLTETKKFKVGDVVKITSGGSQYNETDGFYNAWNSQAMDKYINDGKEYTIEHIGRIGIKLMEIDIFSFPPQALTHVQGIRYVIKV